MSEKKVLCYTVQFYYPNRKGSTRIAEKVGDIYEISDWDYRGGLFYTPNVSANTIGSPSIWSLVKKGGLGWKDRIIIKDINITFKPNYASENSCGAIKWSILRVDNKKYFPLLPGGSINELGDLNQNDGVAKDELQLIKSARAMSYNWSTKSQHFSDLNFDLSGTDDLLLLMDVWLNDAEFYPSHEYDSILYQNYIKMTKPYCQFEIAMTYGYSHF